MKVKGPLGKWGLLVLLFTGSWLGCSGSSSAPAEGPRLEAAAALSKHYVEVAFSSALGERAPRAEDYWISASDGSLLAVHEARVTEDGKRVILTTDPQRSVEYRLTVLGLPAKTAPPAPAPAAGAPAPVGTSSDGQSTSFAGSQGSEPFLEMAVALDNTSVLLTFNEPVSEGATRAAFYRIVAPDDGTPREDVGRLDVLSASLNADGTQVLLTTSPQRTLEYTVTVTNVKSLHGRKLIDPTLNTARFFGTAAEDTRPPRILGAVATSSTSLLVTFDEPVDDSAGDAANYTLSPPVKVTGATLSSFRTQVHLTTMPLTAGVLYTVTAANVRDLKRNPLDPAARSATFAFGGTPGSTDPALPRVVGAASTGNTTVHVQFSKPMSDSVLAASRYVIVQTNQQPEAGLLIVTGARFLGDGRMDVELTTRSQNELTYTLTVMGVTDLTGNPLAPKQVVAGAVVDPTSATFPGTPPSSAPALQDADSDGLPDHEEQRGWVVTVTAADGQTAQRDVTSDPDNPDTDGDQLSDTLEKNLGTDPRDVDTDGDQLEDGEEFNLVYSDPARQDSDADGISDSLEVEFFKTNAVVADSDGDGFADGEELFEAGRDPRLADLPQQEFTLGNVRLQIDERFTITNEEGETRTESASTSATLATSSSSSQVDSSGVTGNFTAGIMDCQSDCEAKSPADFFKSLFFRAKVEGGVSRMTQTDVESARAAEEAFESSQERARELSRSGSVTRELLGARMDVELTLRNSSDVAFALTNLEITVSTPDSRDPTRLVPVATLVPNSTLVTGDPAVFHIGPGQTRGPILFSNNEVFPNLVEDLLRAPRGLVFRVVNYDLTTGDGRNFAYGLQTVRERTTGITIDFGDGRQRRYQAITAGVLDRPRDELRCAAYGDHPEALCEDDADCGTSAPCTGGSIVGGFSNYGGTGRSAGVPLDFVLRDILKLRKVAPRAITAGTNGVADTLAQGDDVQVHTVGSAGLLEGDVVVAPGRDGVLDSVPAGDDTHSTEPDGILAGTDGVAQSIAGGDDVQLVPVGLRGVPEDTVIIAAGENGVLDTWLAGDDRADIVTGYEVSRSCGASTPFAILAGRNGRADTHAAVSVCAKAYAPHVVGEACFQDSDCGQDANTGAVGLCGADTQVRPQGTSGLSRDAVVVGPGAQGFVMSVPGGDDVFLSPGMPCTTDLDCRADGVQGGSCNGPQVLVRMENRRRGQFRRFWATLLQDQTQFQTDFGRVVVRPGEVLGLAFIQDLDRDGLTSEAEFVYGSSDFKRDTDGDSMDDFIEARVGWEVGVVGQPLLRVYPDPRSRDSDRDGLSDLEESDSRPLHCTCGGTGPRSLLGSQGAACRADAECPGTTCVDVARCSLADYIAGRPCSPCGTDVTLARTDPRNGDTDGDGVTDAREVFGYATGAGVSDPVNNVIIAGADLTASSVACPQNHCAEDSGQHCTTDGDCVSRQCIRPVPCDDVQVVPPGTGVRDPRTVVVAPGAYSHYSGTLVSAARSGDERLTSGDNLASSRPFSDDVPVVGLSGEVREAGSLQCADGSRFNAGGISGLPERFLMCGILRPGANGRLDGQLGGDDVLVPEGAGQKLELSDPLNPDTDLDEVSDGLELVLGSSPNDPGDTGIAGDRDRDGLTDNQERSGWNVTYYGVGGTSCADCPRRVTSNPNVMDTDLDGLPDYAEAHLPCNAVSGAECPSDPNRADTDGDGLSDFDELSAEQLTWLGRFGDFFPGYQLIPEDSRKYGTNPTRADTDGDGLSDRSELLEGWTVLLADGSVRRVLSDPTKADTDADGLSDAQERHLSCYGATGTCPTDPQDADTDGDGRLDGVERTRNTNPLVEDMSITVNFRRIEVDTIEDPGGTDEGEFGWWFLVRSPSLGNNPRLVSSALDASSDFDSNLRILSPPAEMEDGRCVAHCQCYNLSLDPEQHHTIALVNASQSFALKKGESFTVEGLLAEFDAASNNCGESPYYIPSSFRSQCYTRFSKVFNYSELGVGGRGETLAINPVDGGAQGGDSCSWQVQMVIEVN